MVIDYKYDKKAFESVFEFMNYTEFVLGQKFYYKQKDLSQHYFNAYCSLLNEILSNASENALINYAKLKHIIVANNDIKSSIRQIKKRFLFGNNIDYRFILLSQLLYALEILKADCLMEATKEMLRIKLGFSKKRFLFAMECASDYNKITDDKILKSFNEYINFKTAQHKYKNTKIKHIGICANMSCGKSTFLNALLGGDYLPARNDATTACVTSVYNYAYAKNMLGIAADQNEIYAICDDINSNIIDAWNANSKHIILQADLDNISNNDVIVAINDTPGVNNSANNQHKQSTMEFFNNNKMDVIIYIANAEHLATEDDKKLLVELREKILLATKSEVLFVINKFDSIDTSKENKDEIIARYAKFLENLGFEQAKIYPLSSKAARLFKMVLNGKAELFSENEEDEFMPFLNKFSKRMNLAIKSTNHYRKKQEGIVMINGHKVELLQVCQALKNTGLLDLESDIEKLLSSK